jgi:hypothetical protein
VLERLGGWRTDLGKLRGTLRTGEDHEFYLRLIRGGARGIYEPLALVHHYVPADRLERAYFRRWFLGNGRTVAQIEAEYPSTPHRILGVPRYLWRDAARDVRRLLIASVTRRDPMRFAAAGRLLWFAGFLRETWRLPDGALTHAPRDTPDAA